MGKLLIPVLALVLLFGSAEVWAAGIPATSTSTVIAVSAGLIPTATSVSSPVLVTPTQTPYYQPTVVTAASYTGPSMEMTPVYYVIHTPQDWSNYNSEIPIGSVDLTQQMLVIFPDEVQAGFKPRQVEIRSACVLSDRIEIDYFYEGDLVPVATPVVTSVRHHRHGAHAHSMAVILPQSDLPIDARLR